MERLIHERILEALQTAKKPLFISDERIDGDSLGASLAMADWMKGLGKPVQVYVKTPVPEKYRFLPGIEQCTHDLAVFQDPQIDLIVVFDCSDARYIEGLTSRLPRPVPVVNIDHHATNTAYGTINQVLVSASATAAVVYKFFLANGITPSRDVSTCLLAGICFDTSVFSNSATNEHSLQIASELILHGGRIHEVIRHLFLSRSIDVLRVWGVALQRLHENPAFGAVITCLTLADLKDGGVLEEEVEGLSNFLSLVLDADTTATLRETHEGSVVVSLRSRTLDVSLLAKANGGGGHRRAAGYTIAQSHLEEVENGAWSVVAGSAKT